MWIIYKSFPTDVGEWKIMPNLGAIKRYVYLWRSWLHVHLHVPSKQTFLQPSLLHFYSGCCAMGSAVAPPILCWATCKSKDLVGILQVRRDSRASVAGQDRQIQWVFICSFCTTPPTGHLFKCMTRMIPHNAYLLWRATGRALPMQLHTTMLHNVLMVLPERMLAFIGLCRLRLEDI